MKPIVICMLFASAAFAVDQFNNRPNNLVYNFEQHRIDQPPQVENRDEDINKYRNRPRTTPAPLPHPGHHMPEHHSTGNHPHHLPGHHMPGHHQQHETTPFPYAGPQIMNGHLPATMPPPPAPKWLDLGNSQLHSAHTPHREYSQMHNMQPRFTEAESRYPASPVSPANAHPYTGAQQSQSRGNHKFSFDDLLPAQPVTTTASAPILPQSHPRPVPTLSPWSGDNFGK